MSILLFLMVCSFKIIFLKRSQVLIYLQKNIHPKLCHISMYFQDVLFFSLTILQCSVSKFFRHKNICVNNILTILSSPLGMEESSLIPAQQQCPRLFALINQLHHQNMVFEKPKNILELKSYREHSRSLNPFLYFKKK